MNLLYIQTPRDFNFRSTINSHGWYDLPPFHTDKEMTMIQTIIPLTINKHALVSISEGKSSLKLFIVNSLKISKAEIKKIKDIVRSMFRIDESLDEFYSLCRKEEHLRWVPKQRAGRMLRSPSVFEDVVKMMFTTNCSWALTKIQTENLTKKLGKNIIENFFTFPSPEDIAKKSESWLRKEISCGYRAPYLLELCKNISKNRIELESMRNSEIPSEELYWKLRSIKGIGHYAAGNVLKLLGRYDFLGIDSWVRSRFSELHRKGRVVADSTIEKHYHRYGKWRGLICLMEVTSTWHE